MKKIFLSGAYLSTCHYCLSLFSSSRPLIRINVLLSAAPLHTQLRTLKPMLSNTVVASQTTGKKLIPSETSRCMASICTFQVANYSSYHEYVYIFSQVFTEVIPIADFLIYTILMILHSFIDVTHLSKSNKFYRISLMYQT